MSTNTEHVRQNAGYTIISNFVFAESDTTGNTTGDDFANRYGAKRFEIVLARNERGRYCTWECKNGTDYYWGHYFDGCEAARRDFLMRCAHMTGCVIVPDKD